MDIVTRVYLDGFALCVCFLVAVNARVSHKKKNHEENILTAMLLINAIFLVIDGLCSVFQGLSGSLWRGLLSSLTFIAYLTQTILLFLLYVFADSQMHAGWNHIKKAVQVALLPNALILFMLVMNPFFHWIYYFDSSNRFHTGEMQYICTLLSLLYISILFMKLLINRKRYDRHKYSMLTIFFVVVLAGTGMGFLPARVMVCGQCMTLAILLVCFSMQSQNLSTDYLTGLFNRDRVDAYVQEKIRRSSSGRTFSCIMIDLDNFKEINDHYGHDFGDEALETAAKLMKAGIRKGDFLARVGGDEFLIVLDLDRYDDLQRVAEKIRETFNKFNQSSVKPYKLSLSLGFDVYHAKNHLSWEKFYRHIDSLMYHEKWQKKRKIRTTPEGRQAY